MKNYQLLWQAETGLTEAIPVRFFVYEYDANAEDPDQYLEMDHIEFEEAEGDITYERHTVRENGVSQICLTKMPRG